MGHKNTKPRLGKYRTLPNTVPIDKLHKHTHCTLSSLPLDHSLSLKLNSISPLVSKEQVYDLLERFRHIATISDDSSVSEQVLGSSVSFVIIIRAKTAYMNPI